MQILNKRFEQWGIDVDVSFEDEQGKTHTITMRFDSEEQINTELQSRIDKQIFNITQELNEAEA